MSLPRLSFKTWILSSELSLLSKLSTLLTSKLSREIDFWSCFFPVIFGNDFHKLVLVLYYYLWLFSVVHTIVFDFENMSFAGESEPYWTKQRFSFFPPSTLTDMHSLGEKLLELQEAKLITRSKIAWYLAWIYSFRC